MKDRDGLLVERAKRRSSPTLEDFYWRDMNEGGPGFEGHYLVVQRHSASMVSQPGRIRSYRWVRYWNGEDWYDAKADKYGPITHWMPMPDVPDVERGKRHDR